MAASEPGPRVALLARAGEACVRIDSALREAGAEVVLVADPLQAAPEQVRDARPQAILVALDPAIEDAIERYGDVLADPDYMVIFEEADQAAQRTGWDAARWLRHLSAKLHRHGDVLPAGAEQEEALHPTPGPLPEPHVRLDFEQAIETVTGEARELADEVPRDGLSEPDVAAAPAFGEEPPAPIEDAVVLDGEAGAGQGPFPFDAGGPALEARVQPAVPGGATDAEAGLRIAVTLDGAESAAVDATVEDDLSFDPERFSRAGQAAEANGGIEEFLAAQGALAEPQRADVEAEAVAAPADATTEAAVKFDFSGLSLVEDDVPPPPPAPAAAMDRPAPAFDLDTLGSGLSLADPDSYGHGPMRGAVLIEAGLGGPDAVRQLLASIPGGFPRPILIRLALEGGRYDRLVRQMSRATEAPVALAEPGQAVQPGSIYFVPPGLGVRQQRAGWAFDDSLAFDPMLVAAGEGAVLFLSGADAAMVPALAGGIGDGGLVLAQTPDEGCYDPAAASAAIAAGADHGAPAALALRLLERWPPQGSDPDPSGMLSP